MVVLLEILRVENGRKLISSREREPTTGSLRRGVINIHQKASPAEVDGGRREEDGRLILCWGLSGARDVKFYLIESLYLVVIVRFRI